jgi:hypothetical protein
MCVTYFHNYDGCINMSSSFRFNNKWIGICVAVGFTGTLLDIYMLRYMKQHAVTV